MKTAIKVGVWLGLALGLGLGIGLVLVLGVGLDYGLGFSSDIRLRHDAQLRVSYLATTLIYRPKHFSQFDNACR